MIVEQFLPAFHYGDATGNSALCLHEFLASQNIESHIIALTIDENIQHKASFFKDYKENPHSLKILHFAVPSSLTDFFLSAKGKKAMVYHNVTPSHFFTDFSPDLARFTHEGRKHLARLADCFDLSIAVSNYNASELKELGFKNVRVFPLLINLDDYAKPFNIAYYNLLKDERKNIIFVGRITPNKKIEDLVKTFFFYKKYISGAARLIIAGNPKTLPGYFYAVRDLASRFYLSSDDIVFTGHIHFDELLAIYRLADLYLSLSEHEGFCLPLIESCYFQVPILAYDACAISETLRGAGILVKEKNYEAIAALADIVLNDDHLKTKLKQRAGERIAAYREEAQPDLLLELLKECL